MITWKIGRMAQEDQTHKCIGSNSSSSSSSKKQKEKKVPQRGLGVAQLEKIRLEEQQKKVIALSSSSFSSSSSPSLSLPNYRNFGVDSVPFPSVSAHNVGVKRPSYDDDYFHHHQLANFAYHNACEIPGNSKVPKVWNSCEYYVDKGENSPKFNPGLALNMNLPREPNPIRHHSGLLQRTQQFDQISPSMVNVQTPALLPPALSIQMEPPSNQSYYGNNALIWPEEEQMAGKKRLHAFLDHPPGPSFNLKFPTFSAQPRADGSTSCGDGSTFNPKLREGPPSYSASIQEPNSENGIKENSAWNENLLTLSLPAITAATSLSSKFNLTFSSQAFHNYNIPDFETNPYEGIVGEPILRPGLSRPSELLPFHSFFPPAKKQNCEATSIQLNDSNGGTDENVDLNLKL